MPLGTAFTYQGRLDQNSTAAPNGIYQITFWLWAGSTGGNPLASNTVPAVPVTNGLFVASVDFGATAFAGEERWLGITVRTNNNALPFTLLSQRTRIAPAPNAIYASTAGTVTNRAIQVGQLATAGAPASGQVLTYDGSQLTWQSLAGVSGAWATNGNTAAAGSFLGTVNNVPLELRANNTRALRLEPNATSANIIGGFAGNYAENGVVAGVLAGGGAASWASLPGTNRVLDSAATLCGGVSNSVGTANGNPGDAVYASLVGGHGNSAEGQSSTIGGGAYNHTTGQAATIGGGWKHLASGPYATVGGGAANQVTGFAASVGGGDGNRASGEGASISGGTINLASGIHSTVAGGWNNAAIGVNSFAAGFTAWAEHDGSFVWADYQPIPGGARIFRSRGPNQFCVRASGGINFVDGHVAVNNLDIRLGSLGDSSSGLGWYGVRAGKPAFGNWAGNGPVL